MTCVYAPLAIYEFHKVSLPLDKSVITTIMTIMVVMTVTR